MECRQEASKAREYATRLFKFRTRSEKEIRDKLKNKEFSGPVIEEVVDFLKKTKLLDDGLFARLWVAGRIKRPLGMARLRRELKAKGIAGELIEEALDRVRADYDEAEIVTALVRRKAKKMSRLTPEKIRSRLYAYLIRRGFPQGLVIHTLIKEVGHETIIDE